MDSNKPKRTVIDNGRMRICVEPTEFKGRLYVDVRNYFTDEGGALQPTPKGVMVRDDNINAVIDAMIDAAKQLGVQREATKPRALYFFARRWPEEEGATFRVSELRVFEKLSEAVKHLPSEFDATCGFIAKSFDFVCEGNMYVFSNAEPMARWSKRLEKWKRVPTE